MGKAAAIGGDTRRTTAVITMDDGNKIAMDSGSGNGQQWHNGWWNGKAIAMGDGTAMARTATMTQKLVAAARTTTTMTANAVGGMATTE